MSAVLTAVSPSPWLPVLFGLLLGLNVGFLLGVVAGRWWANGPEGEDDAADPV